MSLDPPSPAITDIGQIAIPVAELEVAIRFYRDVLGLPLLFRAEPGLAFLRCGTVRLMLSRGEGEGPPGEGIALYYRTPDLDVTYRGLVARGVEGVEGPHRIATLPDHELWMAFVRDPDHHLIGLMEERPLEKGP